MHHCEIVRDEHVGKMQPLLKIEQQIDDLRLDVHVERGDRLIRDDEVRLGRESARDGDALALSA